MKADISKDNSDDARLLLKKIEQERNARLSAERALEDKSRELLEASRQLEETKYELDQQMETLRSERDRVLTLSRLDLLTRLINRATFVSHLEEVLKTNPHDGYYHWLFLIDLRGFKKINSLVGQHGGDLVLKEVGRRLQEAAFASNSLAARLGGNEFAISTVLSTRDAANFADFLRSILEASMNILGRRVIMDVNIGAAGTNIAEASVESLRGAAYFALLKCRKTGSSRVCLFDPSMQDEIVEKLDLEVRLRQAIRDKQIEPWFQPIVDSSRPDRVSFEVLARWSRPDGMVPPDTFIPLATKLGFRRRLDADLFLTASELALPWIEEGWLKDLSFNVPPSDLFLPSFLSDLDALLEESPIPNDRIVMEITEAVFIEDLEAAREKLEAIKARGVRIALDDFGTGYSNLRSMIALPFSKIKLDRSLIAELESNDRVTMLVSAVTQWARAVNIGLVAEGVENEAQFTVLKALGCSNLQGYYFGHALPAQKVWARYGRQGDKEALRA